MLESNQIRDGNFSIDLGAYFTLGSRKRFQAAKPLFPRRAVRWSTPTQGRSIAVNPYGYFDEAAREYVITRPDTPIPGSTTGAGRYGGIISNTAGGYLFDRDPRNRPRQPLSLQRRSRRPARSLPYLRDQETGEFWSPTWQPVRRDLDATSAGTEPLYEDSSAARRYRVRGSLLRTADIGERQLPLRALVLRVRNSGERRRHLRSFSYIELSFPTPSTTSTISTGRQHIVASNCANGTIKAKTVFSPRTIFFSSSSEPYGSTATARLRRRCHDLSDPIFRRAG